MADIKVDDGELDMSDLTVERLWNAAKRHTVDPAALMEITVLATIAGVTPEQLAARVADIQDLGPGAVPLSGGTRPVPDSIR